MTDQTHGRHRQIGQFAKTTAAIAVTATLPGVLIPGLVGVAHAEPALDGPTGGWDAIIDCESGGNPRAQNPSSSASGLYQITDPTWHGLGGKGHAKDASPEEQTRMAEKLYSERGTSPWKASEACWEDKTSHEKPKHKDDPKHEAKSEAPKPVTPVAPKPTDVPVPLEQPKHPGETPGVGLDEYVVQPGDSLSKIAQDRGYDWHQLYDANKDQISDPSLIRPGQALKLVSAAPTAPADSVASNVLDGGSVPAGPISPAAVVPSLADKLGDQLDTGFGGVAPKVAQAGHLIQAQFDVKTVGGVGQRPGHSDHETGHALDFMVNRATGDRIADFVLRNMDEFDVKYVIWRQRINEGDGWEPMEDRGSTTQNHYDHVHVSFN